MINAKSSNKTAEYICLSSSGKKHNKLAYIMLEIDNFIEI